jgi:hypothetical protein
MAPIFLKTPPLSFARLKKIIKNKKTQINKLYGKIIRNI